MLNKAEKEVMKVIDDKGCEFPNGAGVAGPEGEKRRCSLTKRLHDLFYDMSEENKTRTLSNRHALKEKLEKLAYDEQAVYEFLRNWPATNRHSRRAKASECPVMTPVWKNPRRRSPRESTTHPKTQSWQQSLPACGMRPLPS